MTFRNPIIKDGCDPWIVFNNDLYYYCYIIKDVGIFIACSKTITNVANSPTTLVWKIPHDKHTFEETWAPELHFIDGKWYIYVSARENSNSLHKIFVLQSKTDNPQGDYILKGTIHDEYHHWGIDGTTFTKNGKRYFVWSGIHDGQIEGERNYFYGHQHLYIAKMKNPWTIEKAHLLSQPQYPWEKSLPYRFGVNEGPQVLEKNGKIFIIYSASHSSTPAYCLGMLELTSNKCTSKSSWFKHPEPVFCSSKEIVGPGHACFTVSPDMTEDWIVYHSLKSPKSGWGRQILTQKFTWDENGRPYFGKPLSKKVKQSLPSGEEEILNSGKHKEVSQPSIPYLTLKTSFIILDIINNEANDFILKLYYRYLKSKLFTLYWSYKHRNRIIKI